TVNKSVLFKALCVVAVSRGWWTPNLKLSELTRDCFFHLAFIEYVPQETLQRAVLDKTKIAKRAFEMANFHFEICDRSGMYLSIYVFIS
ncbi:hypothetical protein AVEN_139130-1, partial [Araneus ventricosus]